MFARILARLARALVKTPVVIVLGLVAAYFLFAWFAFEPLLKWAAPRYVADKSRHQLVIGGARLDPLALSLSLQGVRLAEPDGRPLLAFDELFVDFEAASLVKWAYVFETIRLVGAHARLELRADGRLNWSALIEAFKDPEEKPDRPLPRLLIHRLALESGRLEVADGKVGFATALSPLALTLTHLSTLPEDRGTHTLAATTELGARVRWKGEFGLNPVLAHGEIAVDDLQLAKVWPYLETRLNLAPPEGVAALHGKYRVGWAEKTLSLQADELGLTLQGLVLRGIDQAQPTLALERVSLGGGRFDLRERRLDIGEIALSGGRLSLQRDGAGRLDVEDWLRPSAAAVPADEAAAPAPRPAAGGIHRADTGEASPWQVNLARFSLDGLGIRFTDAGFAAPLSAEATNLRLEFAAHVQAGRGVQAVVEGLGVDLSGIRLASAAQPQPLFVLGGLRLADGRLDLAARQASVGRLSLANGRLEVVHAANGRLPLLAAFQPAAAAAPRPRPAPPTAQAWRWRVGQLDLSGFQLVARDESVQPAAGLILDHFEAAAGGLSDDLSRPLPVRLGFKVREGGRFDAAGKVVPARPGAELKLSLTNLALTPAQPYLAKTTNLLLTGGRLSTSGQAHYTAGGFGYAGGFRLDDLLVNEASSGERFLAWKALASDDLKVTPAGLEIGELRLERPGMKLVIFADKSTSLALALRKGAPPAPAAGEEGRRARSPASPWDEDDDQPAAAPARPVETQAASSAPAAERAAPAFRVDIERVRVQQGEMDFADLSLALPFATRIHELKGHLNGIGNQPGIRAELELDGRVDEFGLARAVGQLEMFDPTGFMDLKVVFQNVEMTRLTPYTATFVGRKIESGKLSLDLEYKIEQRLMQGENKIVMNRLVLGERVESPTAKNLPLDLAIAILQDSRGVIDLDLPVSGSLDDPKFSYGRIIWKAIGNLIGKLVTAPFRALAALFGGSGEKLEKVAFEAGVADLTPPEREKFKQIAQILDKRPGLALAVQGAWSAEIDRPAMRERQLRRAVAGKMGVKLAADEDPGPLSTTNAKVRAALETLYAERFGEAQWQALQAKWSQANPDRKRETAAGRMVSRLKSLLKPEEPLSAEDMQQLKGADLHALLYQRLLERETVDDAALLGLAQARGRAVVDALVALGAPAARVQAGAVVRFEGEGREVPVSLELGVARR